MTLLQFGKQMLSFYTWDQSFVSSLFSVYRVQAVLSVREGRTCIMGQEACSVTIGAVAKPQRPAGRGFCLWVKGNGDQGCGEDKSIIDRETESPGWPSPSFHRERQSSMADVKTPGSSKGMKNFTLAWVWNAHIALQMPFSSRQAAADFNVEEIHFLTKVAKSDRK